MREEDRQQQLELVDAQGHRLRRGRGIYLFPSALTVANLLCGFYAILATLKGGVMDLDYAARAIGFAILFDAFDGFVARATKTNTEFGKQFDSLADMVSFGIAPAILGFTWATQTFLQSDAPEGRIVSQVAWVVSLAYVICCAWRLARFNVHGMAPAGALKYFVGMPCPAAAGMIAATVHAWKLPLDDWRWSLVWLVLILALAALMVSTIRYPSFKDLPLLKRQHSFLIVVVALLVWSIVVYSEIALMLIASVYLISGPTIQVVRMVRHRLVSRTA